MAIFLAVRQQLLLDVTNHATIVAHGRVHPHSLAEWFLPSEPPLRLSTYSLEPQPEPPPHLGRPEDVGHEAE